VKYQVEKATLWEQVNEAAGVQMRCIFGGRPNHERAKQTWEVFSSTDDVIYFLVRKNHVLQGYVRLLCVSEGSPVKTWIADFVSPSIYEPVVLAAKEVDGTLLVKGFGSEDDLLAKPWPRFGASWPKLEKYPYHNTQIMESTWMVVI